MTSTTRQATAREPLPPSTRNSTTTFLVALFVIYLVLLAWIVLWKLGVPWIGGVYRVIKLVPFAPSGDDGASAPFEVVANLALFVPFGVYLGLLAPSWAWWKTACAVAGASLVLEVTQYVFGIGSSDVTDVITNTVGGLAGLGLLALARRRLGTRTTTVMTRVCSVGTVLVLLASAIFVAAPLRHAQRPHLPVVPTLSAPARAWLHPVVARSEEPG
jgi:glycopeptide antibiotics resistance protein